MCWTEIVSEGYNDVSDLYSPWSVVSAARSTAITALTLPSTSSLIRDGMDRVDVMDAGEDAGFEGRHNDGIIKKHRPARIDYVIQHGEFATHVPEVEKVARSTSFASKLLTFGEQHLLFILVSVHTLHTFNPKATRILQTWPLN